MVKVTLINIEQRLVISVSYCGPWNKLPIKIKRSGSTNNFKNHVKNHYITKMDHTGYIISS